MKNRNLIHKDDWATPPDFLEKIRKEFGDFFDPCPWHHDVNDWNGLNIDWHDVNFINPPYNLKDKTAFVKKGIKVSSSSKPRLPYANSDDSMYRSGAESYLTHYRDHGEGWDGKICIFLLPVSTSTILFKDFIEPNLREKIRFTRGRLRFIGINQKGQHVNYDQIQTVTKETIEYDDPQKGIIEIPKFIKNSGQFDSMLVIF